MAIAKRKKKFFDVEIPILNKVTQLYAYAPGELKGRFIKYDLTRLLRGKNSLLQLKVILEGKNLTTVPREIKLLSCFLKKMVRKGTNYVEDSFSTKCKDAQIRIKPSLITRRKVSRPVRKALREKTKEFLVEYAKNKSSEDIFKEILKNQIQRSLSLKLKKIYPLSLCEIRVFKVEKEFEKSAQEKIEQKRDEPKKSEEKIEEKIDEEYLEEDKTAENKKEEIF